MQYDIKPKERPILLNAEMVRAVLDGRKTQTRRIMKVQPSADFCPMNMELETDFTARWYTPGVVDKDGYLQPAKKQVFGVASEDEGYTCPFGAVGDRLWVREKTRVDLLLQNHRAHVRYEADGEYRIVSVPERIKPMTEGSCMSNGCYREASRITLEITGVRVERLSSISEEDSASEGVGSAVWFAAKGVPEEKWTSLGEHGAYRASHINSFASLWESIYGADSWQANPWVWVIEFKRVEGS